MLRPLRAGPTTSTCSPSGTSRLAGAERGEVDADRQRRRPIAVDRREAATPASMSSPSVPIGDRLTAPLPPAAPTGPRHARRAGPRAGGRRSRCGQESAAARRRHGRRGWRTSIGSSTWNSQRCGQRGQRRVRHGAGPFESWRRVDPGCGPVGEHSQPAGVLVDVGGSGEGGEQRAEAVDGQDDRWAGRRRVGLPAGQLVGEEADQSCPPLGVVESDDRPAVGQRGDVVERLVAAGVDDVAVRPPARRRRGACAAPSSCPIRASRSAPGCRLGDPSAAATWRCAAGSSTRPTASSSRRRRRQQGGQRVEPRTERWARPRTATPRHGSRESTTASSVTAVDRRRGRHEARTVVGRRMRRPSSSTGRCSPELCAVWNTTVSPAPSRSIARPGTPRGNDAGSATPTMSTASARSCRRKAMRRLVLARISSLTTPAGRCVASTRWIPRLRPRWATPTSDGRNPGRSAASVANSSITTTSRGSGRSPAATRR